ncbi:hypothetical protein C8F01DRAFT_1221382 [Mycena amicta]|nr:hypothetical protein C8F01DRAFT_1221382 [Mycena amicta]
MSRLPASLWPSLLSAESAALSNPITGAAKYNDPLIGVRVLGFLLQDLWQHHADVFGLIPYNRLCREIELCLSNPGAQAQNTKIYELGLFYRNHLMRVFRSEGGPLPTVSEHPSRPSLELVRQRIIQDMRTPITKPDARKHALVRDGYRCKVTGTFDYESCKLHSQLRTEANALGAGLTTLECAHIFSESVQDGDKVSKYAASAMAILETFGVVGKVENLVGGNVNKHFNILSMSETLHRLFNRIEFWFEELDTYNICAADPDFFTVLGSPPKRVTFKVDPALVKDCTDNGKPVPALPSPSLLAIRAACSRVAHMAGAVEQADQILRDIEDTSVMAEDGTTAELFTLRLQQSLSTVLLGA